MHALLYNNTVPWNQWFNTFCPIPHNYFVLHLHVQGLGTDDCHGRWCRAMVTRCEGQVPVQVPQDSWLVHQGRPKLFSLLSTIKGQSFPCMNLVCCNCWYLRVKVYVPHNECRHQVIQSDCTEISQSTIIHGAVARRSKLLTCDAVFLVLSWTYKFLHSYRSSSTYSLSWLRLPGFAYCKVSLHFAHIVSHASIPAAPAPVIDWKPRLFLREFIFPRRKRRGFQSTPVRARGLLKGQTQHNGWGGPARAGAGERDRERGPVLWVQSARPAGWWLQVGGDSSPGLVGRSVLNLWTWAQKTIFSWWLPSSWCNYSANVITVPP